MNRRSPLDEYWTHRFDDALPIAHLFRDSHRNCWVRFHSLPESKRYAESESEWTTLLERHNAVATALAPGVSKLELLSTNWSDSDSPILPPEGFRELQLPTEPWRTFTTHDHDEDPVPIYWHVFRSSVSWTQGALDDVIRLVAVDQISNVMILDPNDSWLLHPYDGGMDIILGSTEQRDDLSRKFKDWRSSRSDGL